SGDTATIGAGAKLIDVYDQLSGRGSTVPAGSCPTVGISGLALGGGVGAMARAYGMACGSLTGASVVTADGRLREGSPRQRRGQRQLRGGDLAAVPHPAGRGLRGALAQLAVVPCRRGGGRVAALGPVRARRALVVPAAHGPDRGAARRSDRRRALVGGRYGDR